MFRCGWCGAISEAAPAGGPAHRPHRGGLWRSFMRLLTRLSYIVVLFVLGIMASIILPGVGLVLPNLCSSTASWLVQISVTYILVAAVIWNYLAAVFTSPGTPLECCADLPPAFQRARSRRAAAAAAAAAGGSNTAACCSGGACDGGCGADCGGTKPAASAADAGAASGSRVSGGSAGEGAGDAQSTASSRDCGSKGPGEEGPSDLRRCSECSGVSSGASGAEGAPAGCDGRVDCSKHHAGGDGGCAQKGAAGAAAHGTGANAGGDSQAARSGAPAAVKQTAAATSAAIAAAESEGGANDGKQADCDSDGAGGGDPCAVADGSAGGGEAAAVPGPPEEAPPGLPGETGQGSPQPLVPQFAFSHLRYCWQCRGPQPSCAHHCYPCGVCVVDQDHHCPFINNCVGRANMRNFLSFLAATLLAMVYCAVMASSLIVRDLDQLRASMRTAAQAVADRGTLAGPHTGGRGGGGGSGGGHSGLGGWLFQFGVRLVLGVDYWFGYAVVLVSRMPLHVTASIYILGMSIGLFIAMGVLFSQSLEHVAAAGPGTGSRPGGHRSGGQLAADHAARHHVHPASDAAAETVQGRRRRRRWSTAFANLRHVMCGTVPIGPCPEDGGGSGGPSSGGTDGSCEYGSAWLWVWPLWGPPPGVLVPEAAVLQAAEPNRRATWRRSGATAAAAAATTEEAAQGGEEKRGGGVGWGWSWSGSKAKTQ